MNVRDVRLNKPQDVRRMIAQLINELRRNTSLDPIKRANTIGYLSNVIMKSMELGDIREDIDKIKELIEKAGGND
ncbi:hypothetical protein BK126_28540 [Paenibacillus sp. FSL H7-0326]|uniref:hypothetical protein n=1 Tax=Paenibacillus sp. FSL H7-0326 TaxID=1921144 RepID=UPI00096CAA77|nr:hypothetical protein [Paenibacillus sp. FSL H7-0326]OMC62648.1 hypothetical protein BK126_28540 [Paenibacillus sp. FSL H7-0326]